MCLSNACEFSVSIFLLARKTNEKQTTTTTKTKQRQTNRQKHYH